MEQLKKIIETITGCGVAQDEEIYVLRVYCTIKAILSKNDTSMPEWMIIPGIELDSAAKSNAAKILAVFSIVDLLEHMPNVVRNIQLFKSALSAGGIEESDYQGIMAIILTLSDKCKSGLLSANDSNEVFKKYIGITVSMGMDHIDRKALDDVMKAMLCYRYDGLATYRGLASTDGHGLNNVKRDNLLDAIIMMCNELSVQTERRIQFCLDVYAGYPLSVLLEDHIEGDFIKFNEDKITETFRKIYPIIQRSDPLECMKRLYVAKKTTYYSFSDLDGAVKAMKTTEQFQRINYPLENGICLRKIFKDIELDTDGVMLFIDASPFFIEEWSRKEPKRETHFINASADESDMYELHYSNASYCAAVNPNIMFHSMKEANDLALEWNNVHIVIFENSLLPMQTVQIVCDYNQKEVASIHVLGSDESIIKIVRQINTAAEITTIPSKLYLNSEPSYKSFLRIVPSRQCEKVKVERLGILNHETEPFIQQLYIETTTSIEYSKFSETGTSIRKLSRTEKEKGKQRKRAEVYSLTPEIEFEASLSNPSQDGVVWGKAYYRDLESGKVVRDSKISKKIKGGQEKEFIERYPNSSVKKRNGNVIHIRDIISDDVRKTFEGKPISIATLCYITKNIEDYFSVRHWKTLEDILKSDIGKMVPEYSSAEDYRNKIEVVFKDRDEEYKEDVLDIVIRLAALSYEKAFTSEDSFNALMQQAKTYEAGRANISRMLTHYSLEENAFRVAFKKAKAIAISEEGTAIMIRLLTGLEPESLCALNLGDIRITDNHTVQLVVNKQCSYDGEDIKPLKRENQKRVIPCPRGLSERIGKTVKILMDSGSDKRTPLLSNNGKRLSPKRINTVGVRILEQAGLKKEEIYVYDAKEKIHSIDLSSFSVDIFRSNFSFWGRQYAAMFEDEIRYVLGISRETPAGKNYIDFSSDIAQRRLTEEMQRIEDFLKRRKKHDT